MRPRATRSRPSPACASTWFWGVWSRSTPPAVRRPSCRPYESSAPTMCWPKHNPRHLPAEVATACANAERGRLRVGDAGPLPDRQAQRRTDRAAHVHGPGWSRPLRMGGELRVVAWPAQPGPRAHGTSRSPELLATRRALLHFQPARGWCRTAGPHPRPLAGALWARERFAPYPVPCRKDDGCLRRGHAPGCDGHPVPGRSEHGAHGSAEFQLDFVQSRAQGIPV